MDGAVAEILDPLGMSEQARRGIGRIAECDRQRVALVAVRAAEERAAAGHAGAEIAVGGSKARLEAERELVIGDDALESAAAGAEESAVPGVAFGQPHLDLAGGIGGRRQRCRDTTERRQSRECLRGIGAGDNEHAAHVVSRRVDRGVFQLQRLQVGARRRARRCARHRKRDNKADAHAHEMGS